jgi:hypothetical protein
VSGDIFNHKFDSIVENPLIYLKEITQPGVTVYIDINYLVPRGGGVR